MQSLRVALLLPALALAATPPETDIEILAAAVRVRGYACEKPHAVEPDARASLPDRPAWIIHCECGRFRVIFEGDTGPRVLPLE